MTHDVRAVGRRLRELRRMRSLSIEAVAARTGVAFTTIAIIERAQGKRGPTIDTVSRLAAAYKVSLARVFEGL